MTGPRFKFGPVLLRNVNFATRRVSVAGLGAARCVMGAGLLRSASCLGAGLCTMPCVMGTRRVPVASLLEQQASSLPVMGSNLRPGPVHNAVFHCRRGRAQPLCHRGCPCPTPCVTGGGPCAQRLIVTAGELVHSALCRATPCVAEGGPDLTILAEPEMTAIAICIRLVKRSCCWRTYKRLTCTR